MSMGRVEEKYVVVNAPVKEFIDKDIQKLADVWISMQRKGHAIVHFLEWHPYAKKLLHPKKQEIEFTDIPKGTDLRDVYNKLTREKRKQIMGEDGSSYVTESECREREQQAKKQARREERDSIIENISRHPEFEVRQQDIGDVVGLDGSQVSRILNDE